MDFHITIQPEQISTMETTTGKVTIIPFSGYVQSDLFQGRILPGAADVQTTNAAGIRHLCARYMFEGTDSQGIPCKLFVDNNGYFENGHEPEIFETCPTFLTDSKILAPYLHQARFAARGYPCENGVIIRIYDVDI